MQVEVAETAPSQPQPDSARELKKAIHELRRQISRVNREIRKKVDAQETAEGNRGFMVKDGRNTYKGRIRIEVSSAG
jgi:Sec-independent protein translocase protein TatA